jgi:cyclase
MIRIIARLDIKNEFVIKGIQMDGLRKIGKSVELAKHLNDSGIDEIIYIDTVASLYSREKGLKQILDVSNQLSIPLTVAGGIRNLDDAKTVLRSGADKVAINSQALRNPNLISEISQVFGSQCVVIHIEAKKIGPNEWECFVDNGRERTFKNVLNWIDEIQKYGAGELVISSVDKDGMRDGFDLGLFSRVIKNLNIPWIAASGLGAPKHIDQLLENCAPSGIAVGSAFHYGNMSVNEIKDLISQKGFDVRVEHNE